MKSYRFEENIKEHTIYLRVPLFNEEGLDVGQTHSLSWPDVSRLRDELNEISRNYQIPNANDNQQVPLSDSSAG